MSDEIIAASIGAGSALTVVIIKDFILAHLAQRRRLRSELIESRLRNAYSPLVYLVHSLNTTNLRREDILAQVRKVMHEYGYLLSATTYKALQLVIHHSDGSEEVETLIIDGVGDLLNEYEALIKQFYRLRYSRNPSGRRRFIG